MGYVDLVSGAVSNPSSEQGKRAIWDLLLLDLERLAEQVRQLNGFKPRRLALQAVTAAAALLGAGAAIGAAAVELFGD